MKRLSFTILVMFFLSAAHAQDMTKFKLYSPEENAEKSIEAAVKQAKKEGKYVFIQVGGNWCIWCARYNEFVTGDLAIDSLIRANYIVYHLNYSKENFNLKLLEHYRFP